MIYVTTVVARNIQTDKTWCETPNWNRQLLSKWYTQLCIITIENVSKVKINSVKFQCNSYIQEHDIIYQTFRSISPNSNVDYIWKNMYKIVYLVTDQASR